MLGHARVLAGMAIGRRVTASDVAAAQAEPEVNPAAPDLEAILAAFGRARRDVVDLIDMLASGHEVSVRESSDSPSNGSLTPRCGFRSEAHPSVTRARLTVAEIAPKQTKAKSWGPCGTLEPTT